MGQVHRFPVAVIEGQVAGRKKIPGLLESTGSAAAEPEVPGGIVGMSEVEPPAEVQQQAFPEGRLSRGALGLGGLREGCHTGQSYGSCGGSRHATFQDVTTR